MKNEMFARLVESVKQAVKIYRGEQPPSRMFEIPTPAKQSSHDAADLLETTVKNPASTEID